MRRNASAFTLIELLIVVAIIAILAAIAVPNFLEAQMRSKVARTKSDMRSMATALESYQTDNNKYPPDYTDVLLGFPRFSVMINRYVPLTTPVAYITSVFEDIFAERVAVGQARRPTGAAQSGAPYHQNASMAQPVIRPLPYDYAKFDRGGTVPDSVAVWSEITNSPESIAWALNSAGPNVQVFEYLGFSGLTIYDPTNGTASIGQIIRTNVSPVDNPKQ
jgi:prepilin-type N-terminal cleavage/methylation domain-containing protein